MTLFHRPRWRRQTRVPLGEEAARLDPELIAYIDATLALNPTTESVHIETDTGMAPVVAFVTEEARSWRHPKGEGWHRA